MLCEKLCFAQPPVDSETPLRHCIGSIRHDRIPVMTVFLM